MPISTKLPFPTAALSSYAFRAIGLAQFGGVGDGLYDNSGALLAFGSYARTESAAGRGVELHIPPGVYNFDGKICYRCLFSIKKLRIVGYGVVFQNTYNQSIHGPNFGFELPFPAACTPTLRSGAGALINTTAIGDTSVTLKIPSQASLFTVGDWTMVSSLDVQYYGYPPNLDQFEFVQITEINSGVISFSKYNPLGYIHYDTFPDGGNTNAGGRARIWQLNGASNATGSWDIEHIYEGFEARIAPTSTLSYIMFSGRSIKLVDCTLPGISPSACGSFEMWGGVVTNASEPDKLVGSMLIDGTDLRQGIGFQSSSIDRVTLRNGRGGILAGMTKNTLIQNWDAPFLTENVGGQSYGMARNLTVEASIIRMMPYWSGFPPTAGQNTIDGTDVLFSNGTFAVRKGREPQYAWGIVLGETVNLSGPGGIYSGDLGNGIVTKIYEDGIYVYYETTLPFSSMPSWANGHVRLQRNGNSSYVNCHGCDVVLQLSEAAQHGKRWWEFFKTTFAGKTAASGKFGFYSNLPMGNLIEVRVNVIQRSPVANSLFKISCISPGVLLASTMASAQSFEVGIDVNVAGVRSFTQATLEGKTSNDAVLLDAVPQAALPAGLWYPGFSWAYSGLAPSNYLPYQLPVIDIQLQTDCGLSRKLVPAMNLAA